VIFANIIAPTALVTVSFYLSMNVDYPRKLKKKYPSHLSTVVGFAFIRLSFLKEFGSSAAETKNSGDKIAASSKSGVF